jgi:hypothetical protein
VEGRDGERAGSGLTFGTSKLSVSSSSSPPNSISSLNQLKCSNSLSFNGFHSTICGAEGAARGEDACVRRMGWVDDGYERNWSKCGEDVADIRWGTNASPLTHFCTNHNS